MDSQHIFSKLLTKLRQKDADKRVILDDMKVLVSSKSITELQAFVRHEILKDLFSYSYETDAILHQLACDVLSKLLAAVPASDLFTQYHDELAVGLRKLTHPAILELCLTQTQRIAKENPEMLSEEPEIICSLIDIVCMQNSDLHTTAAQTLTIIGSTDVGQQMLFSMSSDTLRHFKSRLSEHDSTIMYRLLQIVVNCCVASPQAFRTCETNGLLTLLASRVRDGSDVLSCMVAVEIISDLSSVPQGYHWLNKQDVTPYLLTLLLADCENPLMELLKPGAMKYFAMLMAYCPELLHADHPEFYSHICSLMLSTNTTVQMQVVDVFSVIAGTTAGKIVLTQLGSTFNKVVNKLGLMIKSGNTENRLEALRCVANLVSVDPSQPHLEKAAESWFFMLDSQPLGMLLKLSKMPFKDLRCAVHKVYLGLAHQLWGQKLMRDQPSFCEYLLDRSTEKEKEGFDLKYELISSLVSSSSITEVFPAANLIKLKVYLRQGPIYAEASSQVAMDEG